MNATQQYKPGFFQNRPVFSIVLAIVIVLAGFMAYQQLPVAQYPDLVPPSVMVMAQYPGASAEIIAETVAQPLEDSLMGLDGMLYMTSASSNGALSLTVTFETGTDPDMAQVKVSNIVQQASGSMPELVRRYGIAVMKSSSNILQIVAVSTENEMYTDVDLNNYVNTNLLDGLQRIDGVGTAMIMGGKDYAMRIWLDTRRMAQLGVSVSDIQMAVMDQNSQYSIGTIGTMPTRGTVEMTWQVQAQGRLATAEEFGNIMLRTDPEGGVLRIKDVAEVELGAITYDVDARFDGKTTVPIAIMQTPDANSLGTVERVNAYMEQQARNFPHGITYDVAYDTTEFVRISIEEVLKTFAEALLLVFLVVFLFLQNWRATIIPFLVVPISLIGTLAGIYFLGFTLNTLTLFAMILAIGIVVDDAIVVIENVYRIMSTEGLNARDATAKAMHEVTGPIIAIVLVLCAVFIPVAFMGGLAGILYQQFAITICISVILSGILALSLTPALCSMLLKNRTKQPMFLFRWFNKLFAAITSGFTYGVRFFLRFGAMTILVLIILGGASYKLFQMVPTALVPDEDQGMLMVMVMLPDGASVTETLTVVDSVTQKINHMPGIAHVMAMSGFDMMTMGISGNSGLLFVLLDDWDLRAEQPGQDLGSIIGQIYMLGMQESKGLVLPFAPPPITGMSATGGFEMVLISQHGDAAGLSDVVRDFVAAASQRPELSQVNSTFSSNAPRMYLELDREKARMLNVSVSDVFNTLAATLGTAYINDFNMEGNSFRVFMQAAGEYRSTPDDINGLYVRNAMGNMIPITSLVNVSFSAAPKAISHFNGQVSAAVSGNPGPGYSSGQAMLVLEELAAQVLPQGFSYDWSGGSYQEKQGGGTNFAVLGLGLFLVFLILSALYERWTLPLAVLTAVPFAIFGALLGNLLLGVSNSVYTQVAMFTLLGLACKNAILIVEFAAELHKSGLSIRESAIEAARLRFRPIIMTSLAFILGCLPLMLSTSAGAGARASLGVSVVFGMLAATLLAPLIVPYFFKLFMSLSDRFTSRRKPELDADDKQALPAQLEKEPAI